MAEYQSLIVEGAQTGRALAPGLAWDDKALWVQDTAMLLLDPPDGAVPPEGPVPLQSQNGRRIALDRVTLDTTHQPIRNATVFKPRYGPVQALRLRAPAELVGDDGEAITVPEGHYVLRQPDGRITALPPHSYKCRYVFVAAAGPSPHI
ncbi:hypothetical protein C1J03_18565 [Sulfitobacter sp. SK012]|uniref:hypothetical protein n=1 Tax=Sulfitobacter sp. SK012 TaxID=1389005 RepID=UPI000E0A3EA2|nr:hypothetical protein [Sulfitobacter sp. SK012]AXI47837.1 hypothetical protein C1J03_18565 [Sulfitobacter sp. SK012]